ncbi:MAG TPA: AAA family ATPase [Dermatophilaceae bacterium]|nr:AAA family ATPase [Dermatophilaceae bacterium]
MEAWQPPGLPTRWGSVTGPVFVGRHRESAVLGEAWDAAKGGSRQVVFVGGEPGGGKSRLLAQTCTQLHERGAVVLLGMCLAELGEPYQPWVEPLSILRSALSSRSAAGVDAGGGVGAGGAVGVDLGVGVLDRLDRLIGGTRGEPLGDEPTSRTSLYDAALAMLVSAARTQPLVLVLEDLHWASETTLELLSYLVQHTPQERILFVASHRSTPPDRSADVVHTIAQLYRLEGVRRLDLGPLDVEDIAEYVAAETGVSARRAREAATLLRDQSGGNPFFLREVMRDLASRGGLDSLGDRLPVTPESVRDIYESRLDRLAPEERRLAEYAAVIGDDVDALLLSTVAEVPPQDVLRAMDSVASVGLVERRVDADGYFRFTHSLARQAVLQLMPSSALARAHADVALTIEDRFPTADNRVQRMAHHFASAQVLGFADKAVEYLVDAARLAQKQLAHSEAAEMYERAARLADTTTERDDLRLRAAAAFHSAGHFERALELHRAVVAQGSPRDRLRAAIAFEATSWFVHLGYEAADLLTDALSSSAIPATDLLRVTAQASLGRALTFTGEGSMARDLLTRTIELARATGDIDCLAHALVCAVIVTPRPAFARTQLERCTELLAIGSEQDDADLLFHGGSNGERLAYMLGDLATFDTAHAGQLRAARRSRAAAHVLSAQCCEASRRLMLGDVAGAAQVNAELLGMEDAQGPVDFVERLSLQTFVIKRESETLRQVSGLITGEESLAQHWAPGLLALYTELGLRQGAGRVLAAVLDGDLGPYEKSSTWPATLTFLADAVWWLRDAGAAARVHPLLAEFRGTNLAVGPLIAAFGAADRYLAMVESVLGDRSAIDLFSAAIEMDRRMRAPLFAAYTQAALLDHLKRTRAPASRIDAVQGEVTTAAQTLGVPRLSRLVGPKAAPQGPDGLTRREVEVLRLLAEGLSNRELAARLVISENTVTNHIKSILMKTGSENRTQAAMYAAAHGLLGNGRPPDGTG